MISVKPFSLSIKAMSSNHEFDSWSKVFYIFDIFHYFYHLEHIKSKYDQGKISVPWEFSQYFSKPLEPYNFSYIFCRDRKFVRAVYFIIKSYFLFYNNNMKWYYMINDVKCKSYYLWNHIKVYLRVKLFCVNERWHSRWGNYRLCGPLQETQFPCSLFYVLNVEEMKWHQVM